MAVKGLANGASVYPLNVPRSAHRAPLDGGVLTYRIHWGTG